LGGGGPQKLGLLLVWPGKNEEKKKRVTVTKNWIKLLGSRVEGLQKLKGADRINWSAGIRTHEGGETSGKLQKKTRKAGRNHREIVDQQHEYVTGYLAGKGKLREIFKRSI